MARRELHEQNRRSWNEATVAHNSHRGDQVAFYRGGGGKLFSEELELLGDLHGKTVVHLQCNSGQDTLSLANLGAEVTGVDISDTAIEFARNLSRESGVPATFVRADVYDWLEETARGDARYDIVFSSYGALCWLSDIAAWARGAAAVLKPGGRVVLVEYHPVLGMYDEQMRRVWDYDHGGEPIVSEEGITDYVAQTGSTATGYEEGVTDFGNPHRCYEWSWPIASVVTALLEAGLRLTALREWTYMNGWKAFDQMKELPDRRWTLPDSQPTLPLMYGLAAVRE